MRKISRRRKGGVRSGGAGGGWEEVFFCFPMLKKSRS